MIGARKINPAVKMMGSGLIDFKPPNAKAAPAKAPINVWEEDEGIPNHQVSRFQKIAASNPAKITSSISCPLTTSVFTVFAMVLATPWSLKMKKALKLKNAAHITACAGVSTLVETMVAIELAESWNPFMKSKHKARKMIMIKNVIYMIDPFPSG